jgi:hypothetical protein
MHPAVATMQSMTGLIVEDSETRFTRKSVYQNPVLHWYISFFSEPYIGFSVS